MAFPDWVDPIIGFTAQMMINRFTLAFDNDLGGFGAGTELTYWCQVSGAYRATRFLEIRAGWIYQNINYNEQKPREPFNYKLVLHGPLAGLIFNF